LKLDRLNEFCKNVTFIKGDIADKHTIDDLFSLYKFDKVINLAAQAGVRYSIDHPYDYIQSNIVGFMNILEVCRHNNVKHLIYASSSSVYGLNEEQPFTEEDKVDRPVSLYAASKKSNELMAHAYSKLYGMHTTGLRFFTVYGPYGRPDMSPTLFANAIANNKPIKVFNNGEMFRDFTYVDDIVNGIANIVNSDQPINEDNLYYGIYNIGCGHKEKLLDFISEIEKAFGKKTKKTFLPMQPGDVVTTYASTEKLEKDFEYKPRITIKDGIPKFINWYKEYYNIKNEEI
jgi:UDP-glucuronate 4-epimerase